MISRVTEVVIRPIESSVLLANHMAPSLPRAMTLEAPSGYVLLWVQ